MLDTKAQTISQTATLVHITEGSILKTKVFSFKTTVFNYKKIRTITARILFTFIILFLTRR